MAIELEQIVGPARRADGLTDGPVRVDGESNAVVTDGHGRYTEVVRRGRTFLAANTAGGALSLNSTTTTGLIVTNPLNSGYNLVLLEVCVAPTTAPAGISTLCLSAQTFSATAVAQTTPLAGNPRNASLGNTTGSVALVATAATLANIQIVRAIGGGPVATGSVNSAFIKDEVAGALIFQPGTAFAVQCLTTAISAVCSYTWEEVAI